MELPSTFSVPVDGGDLCVGDWGGSGPVVLAIHGITASHVSWLAVAQRLTGCRVLAPDLRGRGASRDLPGPYGPERHAADLLAVLDAVGCERALVAGHSMGGFAACALAAAAPARVTSLVLVDGGLPLVPAEPAANADLGSTGLGPAGDRLTMTFASAEGYRDFWRVHPAFAGMWSPEVEAYVDYDLYGSPPELRVTCRLAALREDSVALADGASVETTLRAVRTPAVFLRAVRGFLDAPPPLYDESTVDRWTAELPGLVGRTVDGTNHYSILMGDVGVDAVTTAIQAALAGGR